MKVLLSIKPEFVKKIISGEKLYEYRKSIFKKDVDAVVIYSTKPVGMLIGEFSIKQILNTSPEELWNITNENSGISKAFFMDYFKDRENAYALEISEFIEYKKGINPKEIDKNFIAPQSFKYVDDNWLNYQN
ncbi:ASCH domain-containing protein [Fusibacter paucivorans]|uniref:ASCH domain-containing protein n=1 Tax=Fusibacter paucivorans TaxID=76009 RepID=A0ABS5PTQ3_9FIRM|nr:ASCH domain-containing protein [Fusibacter paucivorans]MBS7528554.1 ASCH domain-containing protein [Fusibacter paucivorans]